MIEFENEWERPAKIKVVGIGGGGGNAINRMIQAKVQGVEFIAINTDVQVLQTNLAPLKIQIGTKITRGLGAGAVPEIGKKAAEEDRDKIADALAGADMVFLTAGMGGGTGTGASPIVAEIAKASNALTVAVVTKPFEFEASTKTKLAEEGIKELKEKVDTLITIPNDKLFEIATDETSCWDTFVLADEVLKNAVAGISDLITFAGIINVDFADVKTIMSMRGGALMGIGVGTGPTKALSAAESAISSPLLDDVRIDGAKGVLINVISGPDLAAKELKEAMTMIKKKVDPDAHIIFGTRRDESMYNEVKITIVATGFGVIENNHQIIQTKEEEVIPIKKVPIGATAGIPKDQSASLDEGAYLREFIEIDDEDSANLETPAYIRRKASLNMF
jgi:cell division protein FtsZ